MVIKQQGCEKKIWNNLSEIGAAHNIKLKRISILDSVETNNQTYILADAEFNSEENEDIADGLSGLYVYGLNKKWEDVLLVYGSAPKSISAGFSAYLFVSDENQIIFGNLKNTRYDDENDEMQNVDYELIQVFDNDDNIIVSADATGKKGYIMVLKKNKQVKKMQLLHDEVVIDTASINYDDGKENHIIVSN